MFAKNEKGYINLCNISTLSYEKDITLDDILPLNDVFVLTGGLSSEVITLILDNKKQMAQNFEDFKRKSKKYIFEHFI